MVFPAAKLLSVALRQLSKPAAQYFQRRAEQHDGFRKLCVAVARQYHTFEHKVTARFYGRQPTAKLYVPALNEKNAVALGTSFFGEVFIFSVAAGALAFEYRRGVLKEQYKEKLLQEKLLALQLQIEQLQDENDMVFTHLFPNRGHKRDKVSKSSEDTGWLEWFSDLNPFPLFGKKTEESVTDGSQVRGIIHSISKPEKSEDSNTGEHTQEKMEGKTRHQHKMNSVSESIVKSKNAEDDSFGPGTSTKEKQMLMHSILSNGSNVLHLSGVDSGSRMKDGGK